MRIRNILYVTFFYTCLINLNYSKAKDSDFITIGTLLPYSGVYTLLGEEITNALELSFTEVNYTVKGKTLKIVKADTEVKPNIALQKARKLISSNKVDILVGPVSSSVALAIRDLVVQTRTPLIIPNAGANIITGKKCSKFITRMSFSNYQINAPMGKWIANQGIEKVFLLAPNYTAGKEQMNAFKNNFISSGGTIVGEEYTPFRKTKDFGWGIY